LELDIGELDFGLAVCEFLDLCVAIGVDPLALLGRVLRG